LSNPNGEERAEAEAIYEQGREVVVAVLLRMDEQIQRLSAQVARHEERILKQEERIAQASPRTRASISPPATTFRYQSVFLLHIGPTTTSRRSRSSTNTETGVLYSLPLLRPRLRRTITVGGGESA